MGTDLAPQREACNLFLLQIYIRLGETLPDAYFQKYAKRRQHRYAGIDTDDDSSGDDVIQDSSIVIIIHIHMMIISHNQRASSVTPQEDVSAELEGTDFDRELKLQVLGDRSVHHPYHAHRDL